MTDQTSVRITYRGAAIALHWLLAVAIIGQIGLAWYMGALPEDGPEQDYIETIHISIGFTILTLTLIRIAIRLLNPPPPLPANIVGWEKTVSKVTHIAFYALMILIPLTGWMLIPGFKQIHVWGIGGMPHFPGFGQLMRSLPRPQGRALRQGAELAHATIMVWSMIGLVALHVLGALKHQFDGRPVLYRMLPFLKPKL